MSVRGKMSKMPGEFNSRGKMRLGDSCDGNIEDFRASDYLGVVPPHEAMGDLENWPEETQDEDRRVSTGSSLKKGLEPNVVVGLDGESVSTDFLCIPEQALVLLFE